MSDRIAGVEISRPDKRLFPDGPTKAGLARYYAEVAEVMLRHLADRPVTMQRFPNGVERSGFYEKKAPSHFPDWVETARVDTADGRQDQVIVANTRTLVYLADQACITPHTWLSRRDSLDRPDQLVFDLDPTAENLDDVKRATRLVGELLDELGLTTYVKTTGSRGYHVLVPLRPQLGYDEVRDFAHAVARRLAEREPGLLTVAQRKSERGSRVLVDFLRNGYGQTVVPPYAVRARANAPVSTPIGWDELGRVDPTTYTVANVGRRLAQRKDPWANVRRHAQGLAKARERLGRLAG